MKLVFDRNLIEKSTGREALVERASLLFKRAAGLETRDEKSVRMMGDALKVRDELLEDLRPEISCFLCEDFSLEGENLRVEGIQLRCKAFSQLRRDMLEGVFVYSVSAGDMGSGKTIMEKLYRDLWGTAFVDAIRELMEEELIREGRISDSFGPGFYGMDISEAGKLLTLSRGEIIGMSLDDSGNLKPEKSSCGLFFAVKDEYTALERACMYCVGNERGCDLCALKNR